MIKRKEFKDKDSAERLALSQLLDLLNKVPQNSKGDPKIWFDPLSRIIITNEDKVRNCLLTHQDRLENRKAWIAPLTSFITALAALGTVGTTTRLFQPIIWQAIFVLIGLGSLIWLIRCVIRLRKLISPDDIIGILTSPQEIKRPNIKAKSKSITKSWGS